MDGKEVYKAIVSVAADLAEIGIEKSQRNQQQQYQFRGIDQLYNTLAPILARHNLAILPRVIDRSCETRTTSRGNAWYSVVMTIEFDLVCGVDGSCHTVRVCGEAMDSTDKATNKAYTAAYKYLCFQTFAIPTDAQDDADAITPEETRAVPMQVSPEVKKASKPASKSASKAASKSSSKSNDEVTEDTRQEFMDKIDLAKTDQDLRALGAVLYRCSSQLNHDTATELAIYILSRRCETCTKSEVPQVQAMAESFCKKNLIDECDVDALTASMKSRFNLS